MLLLKALAVVALWQSRRFDTAEIAAALDLPESEVCSVIHHAREAARVPNLTVVR